MLLSAVRSFMANVENEICRQDVQTLLTLFEKATDRRDARAAV